MLKRYFVLVLFILCGAVDAQEAAVDSTQRDGSAPALNEPGVRNLLEEPVSHSIYGAPVLKFSKIGPADANSLVVGGEIGWVMNKKYMLGLGMYGLSTKVDAPAIYPIEGLILVTNYGGLLLGYRHKSHKLVHMEAQGLLGLGEAFYRDRDFNAKYKKADVYLVFEPAVNAVLNVTSALRLGAGFSIRYVNGAALLGMGSADLSGLSFNLTLQAGTF